VKVANGMKAKCYLVLHISERSERVRSVGDVSFLGNASRCISKILHGRIFQMS
jgi:hypothetical protein